MDTAIFDIETSGLYANFGILLCCSIKEYQPNGKGKLKTFRADRYPTWDKHRTDCKKITKDVVDALKEYDILIAHNGQYFDKQWLNTLCILYGEDPAIRWTKLIDPVLLARRHLRLHRNSLDTLIDYFGIPHKKTHVSGRLWLQAAIEGNRKAMDEIVEHCEIDVKALECVYRKVRKVVERIDNRGSAQ